MSIKNLVLASSQQGTAEPTTFGSNWAPDTLPSSTSTTKELSNYNYLKNIYYINNKYILLKQAMNAQDAALHISDDAINWETIDLRYLNLGNYDRLLPVVLYDGTKYIIATTTGLIFYSTDLYTWTKNNSFYTYIQDKPAYYYTSGTVSNIYYFNNRYLVFLAKYTTSGFWKSAIIESNDLINWTYYNDRQIPEIIGTSLSTFFSSIDIYDIRNLNNKYFISLQETIPRYGNGFLYTEDFITWNYKLNAYIPIAYYNNTYIAAVSTSVNTGIVARGLYYSNDLESWSPYTTFNSYESSTPVYSQYGSISSVIVNGPTIVITKDSGSYGTRVYYSADNGTTWNYTRVFENRLKCSYTKLLYLNSNYIAIRYSTQYNPYFLGNISLDGFFTATSTDLVNWKACLYTDNNTKPVRDGNTNKFGITTGNTFNLIRGNTISSTQDSGNTWSNNTALNQVISRSSIATIRFNASLNKYIGSTYNGSIFIGDDLNNFSVINDVGFLENPNSTNTSSVYEVDYFNGKYIVGIGSQGNLGVSNDNGTTWSIDSSLKNNAQWGSTTPVTRLVIFNNMLHAFGGTKHAYTYDGVTWTVDTNMYATAGGFTLTSILVANNTLMLAGSGGKIVTSTDGINWSLNTSLSTSGFGTNTVNFNSFKYLNGKYIVNTSEGLIAFSTDLLNWTYTTNLFDSNYQNTYTNIDYCNGTYFAHGEFANISRSTDLVTWELITHKYNKPSLGSVTYMSNFVSNGSYYLAITNDTLLEGNAIITTDFVNYSYYPIPTSSTIPQTSNTRAQSTLVYFNNKFYTIGSSGFILISSNGIKWEANSGLRSTTWGTNTLQTINVFNDKLIVTGNSGKIAYSTDGVTWTVVTTSWLGSAQVTLVAATNSRIFAAGSQQQLLSYSDDGITWNSSNLITKAGQPFGGYTTVNYSCIEYINNKYFVGSSTGDISFSTDLETWSSSSALYTLWSGNPIQHIAWNGSVYMVISNTGKTATSIDGINWVNRSTIAQTTNYIIAIGSRFIIACSNNTIAYSDDTGDTWITVQVNSTQSNVPFNKLTYDGTKLLASTIVPQAYYNTVPNYNHGISYDNGSTWTSVDIFNQKQIGPVSTMRVNFSKILNNKLFIGQNCGIISSSDDYGITWSTSIIDTTITIYDIAYGNSTYVLTGSNGFIATSMDAVNWTIQPSIKTTTWSTTAIGSIIYDGSYFVIAEGNKCARSIDGITWTVLSAISGISNYPTATGYNSAMYLVGTTIYCGTAGSASPLIKSNNSGSTWSSACSNYSALQPYNYYYGAGKVYCDESILIISAKSYLGTSGTIVYSTDQGITWNTSPFKYPPFYYYGSGTSAGVHKQNGKYILNNYDNYGYLVSQFYCDDLSTCNWNKINIYCPNLTERGIKEILWIPAIQKYLAVGTTYATILTGTTLDYLSQDNAYNNINKPHLFKDIAYNGSFYLAAMDGRFGRFIAKSTDLSSWEYIKQYDTSLENNNNLDYGTIQDSIYSKYISRIKWDGNKFGIFAENYYTTVDGNTLIANTSIPTGYKASAVSSYSSSYTNIIASSNNSLVVSDSGYFNAIIKLGSNYASIHNDPTNYKYSFGCPGAISSTGGIHSMYKAPDNSVVIVGSKLKYYSTTDGINYTFVSPSQESSVLGNYNFASSTYVGGDTELITTANTPAYAFFKNQSSKPTWTMAKDTKLFEVSYSSGAGFFDTPTKLYVFSRGNASISSYK